MNEKTVVITEKDGSYQIQNNGISEFALLGILECIVFEMKTANRREPVIEQEKSPVEQNDVNHGKSENVQKSEPVTQEAKREASDSSGAPDVRLRIGNAIKAIRALGGRIEGTDLSNLTAEELQSELDNLTDQYKRLKSSKADR